MQLKVIKQSDFQAVSRIDYEQSLQILVNTINQMAKDIEELKVFLIDSKHYATKDEVKNIFKIIDKNLCKTKTTKKKK